MIRKSLARLFAFTRAQRTTLLPLLFAALPGARRWAVAYTNCRLRQLPRGNAA